MIKLIAIVNFFLFNYVFANNSSKLEKISWDQWKEELINEIREKNKFSKHTLNQLNNLQFNPKVVKLDRNQPEFKLSFQEYLNKVIPSIVVKKGMTNLNVFTIRKIQKTTFARIISFRTIIKLNKP